MTSWITRAETAADVAAIRDVNLQAFGNDYEPDVIEKLRADPASWLPGLSIVATSEDGKVVGHVLLSRCRIDETPAVALGPCAVLPDYQKQGVGSAVIRTALAAARAQGEHLVVLLGHLEYYPRFGFRPASTFGIDAASVESGPHLMALPLDDTPVPAGTIHYPPPWGL
ncbi:putative N-acetyltransferase YhbS [Kribbella orskensis]|uniref:N-acetyltransferase YhbS n=1 Tax=Kribbella orskensis TaxID=2512216 RepID=A0ABY2BDX7_9ACTN|nr:MULTISPECIES: N-acetyltransferase [Kribbella]TCN35823.1 putative N-acetyltransferase YhbS [Kribbella sp. VKM Ac-2500]TCO17430.1 putative N-acetyltransferase YhbS [Kribbella orskensis]